MPDSALNELKAALISGDIKRISSISGIGKKTAERIVVELRDKFSRGEQFDALSPADAESNDHRLRDAAKMVKAVAEKITPKTTVEDLIRLALTK